MFIPVIDVFAGPGGLNEGFSSYVDENGNQVFETKLSIEMERSAVDTLKLRALTRLIRTSGSESAMGALSKFMSQESTLLELQSHPDVIGFMEKVNNEVLQFTLSSESRAESNSQIRDRLTQSDGALASQWVLIGGPPCQAYSLAGRSRRINDETFEDDHKHFLYKEYLSILAEFAPPIFVMENVKGMLSSQNQGTGIFDLIKEDLKRPADDIEYELYSLVTDKRSDELEPNDFVVRAENYGIPQRRHRVIIVGVRKDSGLGAPGILEPFEQVTVDDAIGDLPRIRSTISRGRDPMGVEWSKIWSNHTGVSSTMAPKESSSVSCSEMEVESANFGTSATLFRSWILANKPNSLWNHASRGHMQADLDRYYLLAKLAQGMETSPKVRDLDKKYWPNHKNIADADVPFADRFRVQIADAPATTVVSHIAKDGHYYIHPDPEQMRSLTVREAARLQTFPDDYVFLGNRTQQFTQVGNAVPPLLANKIADRIAKILFES